ncbi:MAG TPA: hypothetical protein VMV13_05485 [Candidatus Binataceae bacterium]|nr:hypothetical protein [Candidatus Binataceae bacterium]
MSKAQYGAGNSPISGDSQVISENIYQLVATRARARFTVRRQIAAGLLFALIICALNYIAPAHSTLTERIYGSLMLGLIAVPLWLWRLGIDPNPPFIVLISLLYFYTYGLGVFLLRSFAGNPYQPDVSYRWIEAALGLALAGMVLMLAGYYAWPLIPVRSMVPRFRMRWSDARAVRLAALVMSVFGLLFSAGNIPGLPKSLAQVAGYAQDSFTVGICILIGLWWIGRLSRASAWLLFLVLVPMRLGIGLVGGSSGGSIVIAMTLVLMNCALSHRIPWVLVFAGTAALFIIRPLELPYRTATWSPQGELYNASDAQKMEYMSSLFYRTIIGGEVSPDTLIQTAGARLSDFPMLADVMSLTPSIVPYWEGETYYPLLFKPIPRIVWPDKPEEVTGRAFGQRYGYTSLMNPGTSINFAQLIEQYANFGVAGVIIGMFAIGMVYRLLLSMFVHPEMGLGALVAAVFIVSSLFDIETGTAMVFGGIPWTLLYLFVIDRFVLLLHFELSGVDQRTPMAVQ